jgi:hypothetical protein
MADYINLDEPDNANPAQPGDVIDLDAPAPARPVAPAAPTPVPREWGFKLDKAIAANIVLGLGVLGLGWLVVANRNDIKNQGAVKGAAEKEPEVTPKLVTDTVPAGPELDVPANPIVQSPTAVRVKSQPLSIMSLGLSEGDQGCTLVSNEQLLDVVTLIQTQFEQRHLKAPGDLDFGLLSADLGAYVNELGHINVNPQQEFQRDLRMRIAGKLTNFGVLIAEAAEATNGLNGKTFRNNQLNGFIGDLGKVKEEFKTRLSKEEAQAREATVRKQVDQAAPVPVSLQAVVAQVVPVTPPPAPVPVAPPSAAPKSEPAPAPVKNNADELVKTFDAYVQDKLKNEDVSKHPYIVFSVTIKNGETPKFAHDSGDSAPRFNPTNESWKFEAVSPQAGTKTYSNTQRIWSGKAGKFNLKEAEVKLRENLKANGISSAFPSGNGEKTAGASASKAVEVASR